MKVFMQLVFKQIEVLLLLLLSCFSHVRLCATPQTAAHQAPPSLGFSRQEHWSGLPFPSPMHESESEVVQSCPTLCNPMDCSLPGSSVHGIFQARVLEQGAIAFSKIGVRQHQFFSMALSRVKSGRIWPQSAMECRFGSNSKESGRLYFQTCPQSISQPTCSSAMTP